MADVEFEDHYRIIDEFGDSIDDIIYTDRDEVEKAYAKIKNKEDVTIEQSRRIKKKKK